MALKINILSIAFLVLIALLVEQTVAGGGGDGDDGHKSINVDIPYKIHTVHHHHVQKFPVYKKIEVPVIKEIKVPFPVHFPVKVPYPVIIKPHIVTVPVHHYPVHTSEHQHEEHHDHHHESHSEGHDVSGSHGGW